jgi:hypothetical protein
MKKIDIITPVIGNIDIVKEYFGSWFPIPEEFNLHVYNSKASDLDGTTEYLIEMQKKYGFNLIQEGKILRHAEAVKAIIPHTSTDWILHWDSDVKILDRSVYKDLLGLIEQDKYKVFGKPHLSQFIPKFNQLRENPIVCRMLLPRTYSWMIMFNKTFIVENNLKFDAMRIVSSGEYVIKDDGYASLDGYNDENGEYKYPCSSPTHMSDKEKGINSPITMLVMADVTWQYYWESMRKNAFSEFTDEVWSKCKHKGSGSFKWMDKNKSLISDMKDEMRDNYLKKIKQEKDDINRKKKEEAAAEVAEKIRLINEKKEQDRKIREELLLKQRMEKENKIALMIKEREEKIKMRQEELRIKREEHQKRIKKPNQ